MKPGRVFVVHPGERRGADGAGKFALSRMALQMLPALVRKGPGRIVFEVAGLRHDRDSVAVAVMEVECMADFMGRRPQVFGTAGLNRGRLVEDGKSRASMTLPHLAQNLNHRE